MTRRIVLIFLITFSLGQVAAQQQIKGVTKSISSVSTDKGTKYYGNKNEPPRAIEFNERSLASANFLVNINSYFDIPIEFTFTETESTTDNLGMRHRFLQQNYKGIPLEGMGYRVHERNGFVTSANGKAVRSMNINTQATLSERQCFQLAVQYLQTKDTTVQRGRKLIVSKGFAFSPESFFVAYQFDVDVSLVERWRISIDARSGQVVNKVSLINNCFGEKESPPLPYGTGTGLTNYYGTQTIRVEKFEDGSSRLQGQTEHGGKIGTYDFGNRPSIILYLGIPFNPSYFFSSNNTYSSPYQKPAVSVQWAAEQAYEYYFKKHSRNSFDNKGSEIKSYVHVDVNYDNAFWTGKILAFGDGSKNNPLVELDVVGHELTHGVTQYEAQLQYYNESGALNESFSDIFSKAIEFSVFGDTATWQLAKHFQAGGLRDFSNPNLKKQPDTYFGDLWYTGYEDNGGVHYNSGVQNFWYYLLCKGGSGVNDRQVSYTVNAIGMEAATKIAYRNLTEYLSYFSDYLDSRIGSMLATADLYGKNSAVYQEVDKAWDAVGVVDEPIITNLELFDITATTVKIKGTLLPRGDTVTYRFEYGTTPIYGSSSVNYKYTDKVEGILTGLQSNTKYYLRLVATNENGSSYAATEFTTISLSPLVKIKQTVDVTETNAILYGQINPNSLPSSYYFEYGSTLSFGLVTPTFTLSDTTEFLQVSVPIGNLQSRQTYYYRLVATNSFTSSSSESANFFTAVKPLISSYSPNIATVGTEITIIGQNFNATMDKNIVKFGATRATVLSASITEIKVKVPVGASFGPITLLDVESGLSTQSVQEFMPTFTGEFKKTDLTLRIGTNDIYFYQSFVNDIDGDNRPDIVGVHNKGFSVLQNVNQGGDITSESFVRNTFPSEYSLGQASLVDFDGNGLQDLVGFYQYGLRIYPNLSVPGFIFFGPPIDLSTGYLSNLIFGDFDQDGHIDIAGTSSVWTVGSILKIFRNLNAKGYLASNNFELRYEKPLTFFIDYLTTSDLNNDGTPDLMAGTYNKKLLSVFVNKSHSGNFDFEETMVQDPTRAEYPQYVSHDLNQDGWKDIISFSRSPYQNGNLSIAENMGTSPNITAATPAVIITDNGIRGVKTADINGDGKLDLLVGIDNWTFTLLNNSLQLNGHLSSSSFEKLATYGMSVSNVGSNSVETQLSLNDLNGDGRPEVICNYAYNFPPRDRYGFEIWQNAPANCLDPSLIKLNVTNSATIILPPGTTINKYEIEYAYRGNSDWYPVTSTTIPVYSGYSYRLRVRAKCYLGFTDYYYIDFTTDCANTDYFTISSVEVDKVIFNSYNYYDVQYSPAGKNQWLTLPQSTNQITNLTPGTNYDWRIRGLCSTPVQYSYRQFTTLCPKLNSLTVTNILYNKATVNWSSTSPGDALLEYSADNINWTPIGASKEMSPLLPTKQYFVRGRKICTNINSDFIYNSFTTPCPKVSSVTVDAVTPFNARVNWLDESNTGNYTLTYSITAGGPVSTVQTRSTSFILNNLQPGTSYTVKVAPNCVSSQSFTSTTFTTICFVPFDLSVKEIKYTTAEISWSDSFGGVNYFVDYAIKETNVWQTIETRLTNVSLTKLRPGVEYEVRVHINCSSAKAPFVSQFFKTNVYEETTIAPNPTEKSITIFPAKNLIGSTFSMYDNTGKQVVNGELIDYTIDLSILSPGIYMLKIDGEKPLKIVKF